MGAVGVIGLWKGLMYLLGAITIGGIVIGIIIYSRKPIKCKKCGCIIKNNNTFCENCGAKVR